MSHPCSSEEDLKNLLRAAGLRATSPRVAVMGLLRDARAPLSHAALLERLPEGAFDRATIYRVLSNLSDAGILVRMDLGDHIWRFEFTDPCRGLREDHAHFICKSCDEVSCLPDALLEGLRAAGRWAASLETAQIRIRGVCPDCI